MKQYFIGIDGGGSHTTAAMTDMDGNRVMTCHGDSLHYHTLGYEQARRNLFAVLEQIFQTIPKEEIAFLYIGMSAIEYEADEEEISRFFGEESLPFPAGMHTDAYTALMGHTLGEAGAILISGTGSIAYAMNASGQTEVFGGWGPLLGDEGSAYDIGRKGISYACKASEGVENDTLLIGKLKAYFKIKKLRDLPAIETTRKQIAGFARLVSETAQQGDQAAVEILKTGAEELVKVAKAAVCFSGSDILGIYGGMLQHEGMSREMFLEAAKKVLPGVQVSDLRMRPEYGAIIAGMKHFGISIKDDFVNRLKQGEQR